MMLKKASTHLYTLGNNIYTRTYFTRFSSVAIVDFKKVSLCHVPPYQFKNVEITYCCNY